MVLPDNDSYRHSFCTHVSCHIHLIPFEYERLAAAVRFIVYIKKRFVSKSANLRGCWRPALLPGTWLATRLAQAKRGGSPVLGVPSRLKTKRFSEIYS